MNTSEIMRATWQKIDTAPARTAILVVWHGHVYPATHHPKPYHRRGKYGWRVAFYPAYPWEWVTDSPTCWAPFLKPPEAP
jgi:hypothetical protein